MTIGEQNNKNIMGFMGQIKDIFMDQIQSIRVTPYDDSPNVEEQPSGPDEDALFEFKRDREVREREVDEDLLFEQARELKLEKGE